MDKLTLEDERGFSLTSVMIAAGIMGFLAVVMMKMQDNQLKTQNDMIARTEITGFMGKLSSYLSRSDYCEKTFSGIRVGPNTSISLDKIINPLGRVVYRTGEKYGNNSFRLLSMEQLSFVYDSTDRTSGILTLRVTMEKSKKATGAKKIVKDMELDLVLDEYQKVTGCGALAASGNLDNNVKEAPLDVKGLSQAMEKVSKGADPEMVKAMEKAMKNNPALKMLKKTLEEVEKSNNDFEAQEKKFLKDVTDN